MLSNIIAIVLLVLPALVAVLLAGAGFHVGICLVIGAVLYVFVVSGFAGA